MTMHTTSRPTVIRAGLLLAALSLCNVAAAGSRALLPTLPGDLSAPAVIAPASMQKSAGAPNTSHDAVALSWASGADVAPSQVPLAQSREYYLNVSGAELGAGVTVQTSAPRAVIRLQPLAVTGPRENAAIHPLSLVISDAKGRAYAGGDGMEMLVSSDKLAKADLPFAPGTSAFRMHPDLGSGAFKLQASGLNGADRYLINVVEPDSNLALSMQADAPNYLHGHTLTISPELLEFDGAAVRQRHALSQFNGTVVSPAGRSFALSFKPGRDGRLHASLLLDADEAPAPGLWEVRAQGQASVNGQKVLRSVRLAFPVAMPVARLNGAFEVANTPGSVGLRFGVDVGAPGRYEVRALLYGTVNGALVPLGVAQAAQWLDAGSGHITLGFASELMDGASAPFEVRDLSLLDQGRMGVLHKQQRALVLDERDIVRRTTAQQAKPATPEKQPPSIEG
jgi:hypothetical protein